MERVKLPDGFERLVWRARGFRAIVIPLWDLAALVLGLAFASVLIDVPARTRVAVVLVGLVVVGIGTSAFGVSRGRFAVASFSEAQALVAVFGTAAVAAVIERRVSGDVDSDGFVALTTLAGFLVSGVGRGLWRIWYERSQRPTNARRTLVVVDGDVGFQWVRGMLLDRDGDYLPVALIDDDPLHAKRWVMGVPVGGTLDEVAQVAKRFDAQSVLVAAPHLPADKLGTVVEEARAAGCDVLIVPKPGLADDPSGAGSIRHLTEFDLLQRRQVSADWTSITSYLRGKRVLVTGAGGSIGSELCRQIAKSAPASLVKLDRDESALHATQLSIDGHGLLTDPTLVVADIRDANRLVEVFRQHRPEIVFHAAALKHLSLLEMHPSEAVKTNVDGTLKVIAACADVGVSTFVNVSTDKAADPTSVLGFTKRIGERVTASYAQTVATGKYLSVRFGNVIGSRGSVLHAFRSQAEHGVALTVTHPDVTRFFMTVEEAVLLVIQAGGIGRSGEALILDMGEPVRIDDVARRIAKSVEPAVEIVYTGLRPGEKLHEQLFGQGEIDSRPEHPLISHVSVPGIAISALDELRRGRADEVRANLRELACNVHSNPTVIASVADVEDDVRVETTRSQRSRSGLR